MIFGNGGSAAISSHFSVDLTKNAGVRCTNYNESDLLTCFSNDFGLPGLLGSPLETLLSRLGALVGRLGAIFARLGLSGIALKPSWSPLGFLLGSLGPLLGRLGRLLGRLGRV